MARQKSNLFYAAMGVLRMTVNGDLLTALRREAERIEEVVGPGQSRAVVGIVAVRHGASALTRLVAARRPVPGARP